MENKKIYQIKEDLECWQKEKEITRSVIMITVESDDDGNQYLTSLIAGKKPLLVISLADTMVESKELQENIKIAPMYLLFNKISRFTNASKVEDEENAEQKKED